MCVCVCVRVCLMVLLAQHNYYSHANIPPTQHFSRSENTGERWLSQEHFGHHDTAPNPLAHTNTTRFRVSFRVLGTGNASESVWERLH